MNRVLSAFICAVSLPALLCGCADTKVTQTAPGVSATAEATIAIDEANAIFVSAEHGDDNNDGSRSAPFFTVARAMKQARPGNTVYLMNGVYYETIIPVNGTAEKPFTLAAMPGHSPVCTPAVKYDGAWALYKDNIYMADFSSISGAMDASRAQIFVDREAMVEARYPNMGSSMAEIMECPRAIAQSGTDAGTVVAPDGLPQDIAGAKVVVWPGENGVAGWIAYTSDVQAVSGKTVTLKDRLDTPEDYIGMNAYSPVAGNPFIITGALSLLDAPGEYYYDAAENKMYLYMPDGGDPSGHTITVRGSSKAVEASNSQYVTVKGIRFYGGGIYMDNAADCRIEECSVRYADHFYASGYASYVLKSSMMVTGSDNYITKCEFGPTAFNGITLGGNNNVFTDNIVHHSNYCGADFAAVYVLKSSNTEISRNTITDSGRVHIYFTINTEYDKCVISNNYLKAHSRLTSDSGAFYTWSCSGGGTRLTNNFVDCGTKTANGTMNKCWDGLYLDNYCSNFIVDHNIVLGGSCGLRTNLSNENTIYANNTVIGSQHGYGIYSYPKDEAKTNTTRFYNNLFVSLTSSDINYNGSEGGQNKFYTGPLVDGAVPVPIDTSQRIQSSNNLKGAVITKDGETRYQPADGSAAIDGGIELRDITDGFLGGAPDIGAVEKGGRMFDYGASWQAKE